MTAGDRAGVDYWNQQWSASDLPAAVDPTGTSIWNHINREFHAWFSRQLRGSTTRGKRLLEIGCARSPWLPYFARAFELSVTGLDYSADGVRLAQALLAREGIPGEIVNADMFSPPPELLGTFDVVTSFGVMEHFEDTAAALRAAARFLRPGGLLLTEVPNLAGVNGWLQRALDRRVYDLHVVLDCERLTRAHADAGLQLDECAYLVWTQFGACNVNLLPAGSIRRVASERALFALKVASSMMWRAQQRFHVKPSRWSAGYVMTAARQL